MSDDKLILKYCTLEHVSLLTETAFNAASEENPQGPKNQALWKFAALALQGHREHAEAMLLAFYHLASESVTPPPAMLAYLASAIARHLEDNVSVDQALGLTGKKKSEGLEYQRAGAVMDALWQLGVVAGAKHLKDSSNPLITRTAVANNDRSVSLESAAEILEKEKQQFPSVKKAGETEPLKAPSIKAIYRKAIKSHWPWYYMQYLDPDR